MYQIHNCISRILALVVLLLVVTTAGVNAAPLSVETIGGFHVGGDELLVNKQPPEQVDSNGLHQAGQMYVNYVTLENTKAKYPLLLWHGGGLTGVTYEDTPDGRPGWQSFFLRAGHDVYVSDAVERGRASWNKFSDIFASSPEFRPLDQVWVNFRLGPMFNQDPAKREVYPNQQFPVDKLEQFGKQFVPRWRDSNRAIQAAYDRLVSEKFSGGCVILAHSQGGNFAINTALNNPENVKAVILIEPSGGPDPDKVDLAPLKNIPILMVWGDYIKGNDRIAGWNKSSYYTVFPKFQKALEAKGGSFTWIDLPDKGLKGNSHMLMMDKNSDAAAQVIQDWIAEKGLMR